MPLLDHFRPPLSQRRHWDSFHGAWAEAMATHHNQSLLPERFVAEARVKLGGQVEIDVVTQRSGNLQKELLDLLGVQVSTPGQGAHDLYAAAHRAVSTDGGLFLETWATRLTLGAELPTLPLWLEPDLSLPLDLDSTYHAACVARRIDA